MAVTGRRDLAETREVLRRWLARKLGTAQVDVSELSMPRSGFSNETAYLRVVWTPPDGPPRDEAMVLRIEPTDHQLFVTPDAMRQAEIMRALAGQPGVPVPQVWFTEPDPAVIGSPFYLMGRVAGSVPSDVPSWHAKGWTVALDPDGRARMYDNALTALAALHRIDWRDGFEFLAPAVRPGASDSGDTGDTGDALDGYLADLRHWHAWCADSLLWEPETVSAAVEHLVRARPHDPGAGIVWGDARVGNMCFGDDLTVRALFDWENATIGPRGIDLGWWLMFEDFLCEAQGLTRLAGVPGRSATIERYTQLAGCEVPDIEYYELLAATVMTLINSRLGVLLMNGSGLPEPVASQYAHRTLGMVRRGLERAAA